MTNSKKESKKAQAHAAHASSHGKDNVVTEFGQQLDKENFSGAGSVILAHANDAPLHAHLASILVIEIETHLENYKIAQAKKCLELLLKCAPEREEEANMWFADYHMGRLQKCLTSDTIASFGQDLASVLAYAPQRKAQAHALIGQYFMNKLKKSMHDGKGSVAEMKAFSELMRYSPGRKEEAYHLFAERAMEEMKQGLEDYDKEYAKMAMGDFLKFAPHRKEEAESVWEQHMEASRQRKLYDILGVERDATEDEIRQAYRALAKKLHPDVNMNNPEVGEQMRHVNAAYHILGDPELRARYDQRGDRKEQN